VASCDSNGNVILWDVRVSTPLKAIDFGPSSANMVAFDPTGNENSLPCVTSLVDAVLFH